MHQPLPTFDDIVAAGRRLRREAAITPLLSSRDLDARTNGRILIKAECLQRTGSFKFRGAWNLISQLDEATAPRGVVAYSSGNHAQGVAAAARLRGIPALIVMPADTPSNKLANTRAYGAEIVTYDRATESREEIAARIANERGATLVPPFEHRDIIAGQGTVGLELAEQAREQGAALDAVVVNASGGGLVAGIALAIEALSPATEVWCAEPENFDDHRRSLAAGRRERNERASGSICDALLSPEPGEMTFAVNSRLLKGGLAVSEAEVKEAMRFAFERLKLVVEPGGAVALAAVLAGKLEARGRTIGVVVSGGNVDGRLFAEIVAA